MNAFYHSANAQIKCSQDIADLKMRSAQRNREEQKQKALLSSSSVLSFDLTPPPAYSTIVYNQPQLPVISAQHESEKAALKQLDHDLNPEPSLLSELCLGSKLARKLAEKRIKRRCEQLDDVHDAWQRLGMDTRAVVQCQQDKTLGRAIPYNDKAVPATTPSSLPPHFWNPPRCNEETMHRQIREMGF